MSKKNTQSLLTDQSEQSRKSLPNRQIAIDIDDEIPTQSGRISPNIPSTSRRQESQVRSSSSQRLDFRSSNSPRNSPQSGRNSPRIKISSPKQKRHSPKISLASPHRRHSPAFTTTTSSRNSPRVSVSSQEKHSPRSTRKPPSFDPFRRRHSSDPTGFLLTENFPTKHYSNEESLRMSEERLLEKLKVDSDDNDDNDDVEVMSVVTSPQRSEDESEVDESCDAFIDKKPIFSKQQNRPKLLSFNNSSTWSPGNGNAGHGQNGASGQGQRQGSFASSVWMTHEEEIWKHECDEKCSSVLHLAAKTGNVDEMEILLETGSDPNRKDCMGRTPLHWAVCTGCSCDSCTASAAKCTQLLVDSPRTDIDIQDNNGDTALHLAAENQSTKCASILLYSAADVSIKSKTGVKALALMVEKIPEAMDSLLNRAVSVEKYDPTNVKCELKLDFGAIVGYSETRGHSQRNGKPPPADGNIKARKEMQLLTLILDCSSSARKKILTHPLIGIFLHLKWMKIKTIFWATILLHVVLLLLYTMYILDVYLISCPYRPKITEPAAVKAAKAEGNFLQSENSTYRAEFIKFSWFEFSPQLQELGTIKSNLYEGCPLEIGPTVKSVLLLALTILMVVNEIFKMLPAPKAYWKRTNNRMQWTLFFFIFITSWPVFMSHPNINFWQYQAAAFGIFLGWALMLTQIGKFPILGLYVEILTKVLKNFGFFMITYASLLIAFALAFCVLFPGNAPYSSIPLAILKVLMMMVGEVNYEDLFYGNEENPVDDLLYPITGHILYGAFVIMITIVLMNLLVGLTVSDIQRRQFCIQGLQKDAELTRLSRQIGEIAQLESFVFSKRVQSFLPGSFAAFIRDSILVVPPLKSSQSPQQDKPKSPKINNSSMSRDENWYFHCRPNDANDKSIPEDLKLAIIKLAAARHRNKRTNRCSKIFHRGSTTPATPLLEEYQKYAKLSGMGGAAGFAGVWPPPSRGILTRAATARGSIPTAATLREANEYSYLVKRLEEKIMDRMKIQMDALYQKIEDRMMEQ